MQRPEDEPWAILLKRFLEGYALLVEPIHDLRWTLQTDGSYMINLERNGVLGTYPKDNLMLLLQISVGLYNVDALEEGLSGNEPQFRAEEFAKEIVHAEKTPSYLKDMPRNILDTLAILIQSQETAFKLLDNDVSEVKIAPGKLAFLQQLNLWPSLNKIPASRRPSFALIPSNIANALTQLLDQFAKTPSTLERTRQTLRVRRIQYGVNEQ